MARRTRRGGGILAAVVVAVVAMAGSAAVAGTLAENFQAEQGNGFPPQGSALNRLLSNIGGNQELVWNPPAPFPRGTPFGATHVSMAKFTSASSWTTVCGRQVFVIEVVYSVVIEFVDGSTYVFRLSAQVVKDSMTHQKSVYTNDVAKMAGPNTWRVREHLIRTSMQGLTGSVKESSFAAIRAPASGFVAPGGNLDAVAGGRDVLELRAGPGGALDLRGFGPSNPVLSVPVPTLIFADAILLDSGVTVNDVFAVPPIVSPGAELSEIRLLPRRNAARPGRGADEVEVTVWNQGNVFQQVAVAWSDTLGWATPGTSVRSLPPFGSANVRIPIDVSVTATDCTEDELAIEATPLGFAAGGAMLELSIFADSDLDGDGFDNSVDACWAVFDPEQRDFDLDFEGDRCDLDDGLIPLAVSAAGPIAWQPEEGFDAWNLYRGDLDVLRQGGDYTQAPGSNAIARRECGLATPSFVDLDPLASGRGAFYLVTGTSLGVEGGLGFDSAGAPRPNANPCP